MITLLEISRLITIYFGCFFLITGVIGNSINILVFSTVKNYQTIPSIFYFLIGSITNLIYLFINLTSRVISATTQYDLTRSSSAWCKIRQFFLATLCGIGLSCSCLAVIDQYFTTSNKASLRKLSNVKCARVSISICIFVWCVHGILPLVAYDISSTTKTCGFVNKSYNIYSLFYFLGLITTIPVSIMIIFAYLTHRNIHRTTVLAHERADRQLRRMILIEVVLVFIGFVPFGVNSAYSLITSNIKKDEEVLKREYFLLTIVSLLPYIYYGGSCYMFLFSSKRFRRFTKKQLCLFTRINRVSAER